MAPANEIFDDLQIPPASSEKAATDTLEPLTNEPDNLPIVFTDEEYLVRELKPELKKRGLKVRGNKKAMIKALNDYEAHKDDIHPVSFVKPKMFLPYVKTTGLFSIKR